jgi:hypothetical protein
MNIFKKISLFLEWRKAIIKNKKELAQKFNIRVDGAQRLYTVINIPEEIVGEAYSLKTSDINRISETFIRQYNSELASYLNGLNLTELYKSYDVKKVDKYSYLVVIGFRLFESHKFYNRLYYVFTPIVILLSILLFFII